jgi:uncharacterized membrane protein YtjA (UPF0391 family)
MYKRRTNQNKESILRKGENMSKGYKVGVIMTILGYIGIAKSYHIIPAIIFSIGFILVVNSYVKKN